MYTADAMPVTFITLNHIFTRQTKNYVHRLKLKILTLHLTFDYFYQLIIHEKYEKRYITPPGFILCQKTIQIPLPSMRNPPQPQPEFNWFCSTDHRKTVIRVSAHERMLVTTQRNATNAARMHATALAFFYYKNDFFMPLTSYTIEYKIQSLIEVMRIAKIKMWKMQIICFNLLGPWNLKTGSKWKKENS